MLEAKYPKMILIEEELALKEKLRKKHAKKYNLSDEEWDKIHDSIIANLKRDGKLIVV